MKTLTWQKPGQQNVAQELIKIIINYVAELRIDKNVPVILGIDYDSHHGHWIVAVGYALNENDELTDILTLDPGVDSPMCCLWNGIININKEPKKKYGYEYNTNRFDLVDVAEAIIITRKK